MSIGRPTKYKPGIANEICARISCGETLTDICKDEHMPARQKVWEWQDRHPEFRDAYARARERQMEAMADEILSISDDGQNDWMEKNDPENPGYAFNGEHAQRSRLRVDTRKFLMSKLASKVYGDKSVGTEDNPLVTKVAGRIELVAAEPRKDG